MKRHALIIGINQYDSLSIPALQFAVDDARSLAEILTVEGHCQTRPGNLVLLLDDDASRSSIVDAVDKLRDRASADDLVLFYFAGHGCSERDTKGDPDDKLRKYVLPFDADLEHLDSSAIDLHFLSDRLHAVSARHLIIVLDSCHSGAAGGRTIQVPGKRDGAFAPFEVGTAYIERLSGKGRLVLAACTGTEVAAEKSDLGHGLFTHSLLEGLRGKADFKEDGFVDIEEAWMFAQQQTILASESQQNPVRSGWIEGSPVPLAATIGLDNSEQALFELKQRLIDKYRKYRLQEVRIAAADSTTAIAREAASYLAQRIRSNIKIAVSCGRTLIETISQMERSDAMAVDIFPLNGSPSDEVHITDSMVLSYLLWSKFEPEKAHAHIVPTGIPPQLFEQVQQGISALATDVLSRAKEADIFLFGIGSPSPVNRNIPYLLEKAQITSADLQTLEAVGEINFHLYDKDGTLLALRDDLSSEQQRLVREYCSKFFSLSPDDLVKVTGRAGVELIVVAGGTAKRPAIAAGIKGGFVRTLVTDVHTARWLAAQ